MAPSSLHAGSSEALQVGIMYSVRLIRLDKQHLLSHILPVGAARYESVYDQGRRSRETPDGGFIFYHDGRALLIVIIEVAASEWHRELQADSMLWMNEVHCRTAIL
ncbi:hypothetical protein V1527DRAFT_318628 [Lipomyces starkeyi]